MTLMEEVARFAKNSSSGEVPDRALELAHQAFANWLTVAYHATNTDEGRTMLKVAASHGTGSNVVIGGGVAPGPVAALVNGALAHMDDWDDTHLGTVIHSTTPIIAATLAASDPQTSWDTFLRAVAIGSEVAIRIGELLNPHYYNNGWHATATVGGIGSAVAVATVWQLPYEDILNACGLAALQPIGLRAAVGTPGKSFQVGRAAEVGWTAAYYAKYGVASAPDVLEHKRGFHIISQDFSPEVIHNIGKSWSFLEETFKPYPCGIVTHPAIDAAIALHAKAIPDEIETITAKVHPLVVELMGFRAPESSIRLKFSATGLIALGLVSGRVHPDDFVGPLPSAVMDIERKVELQTTEEVARDEAVLTVVQGSETLVEHVEHAKGSHARPMSWEDLQQKFFLGTREGSPDGFERLWDDLRNTRSTPYDIASRMTRV